MYRRALLLSVLLLPSSEPYVATIDLTKQFHSKRATGAGSGCLGGSMDDPPIPFPITTELLSVDKTEFAVGATVAYEMSLENSSTRDVVIPWTPDSEWEPMAERLAEQPQGYREAMVELEYFDPKGARHAFAYRVMEGADSIPGSVLRLRPGQRARVKGAGTFRLTDYTPVDNPAAGPAKLRALFIYALNGPCGVSLDSKNSINIQVVP
jgi:hypothetical protein